MIDADFMNTQRYYIAIYVYNNDKMIIIHIGIRRWKWLPYLRSSSQEASQSLDLNLRSGMGCWWHAHLERQGCEHCGILTSSSVIHKISQVEFFCESPILSTCPDESQQNSSKGEIICFLANYRVKKQSLGSMKTTNPSSTLIFRSQERRVWKKRESPPSYHRSPLQLWGWMSYHPVQKSWSMSTCQITIWTYLGAAVPSCWRLVYEDSKSLR